MGELASLFSAIEEGAADEDEDEGDGDNSDNNNSCYHAP
jgi:hypothetical protein